MSDISGILSMCRRAGKLIGGMDEVKSSCRKKEARLVLVTSDFSEKSYKDIKYLCEREKVPVLGIPGSMDDVGECVGRRFGVMAVTDKGFAESIKLRLAD